MDIFNEWVGAGGGGSRCILGGWVGVSGGEWGWVGMSVDEWVWSVVLE